MPHTGPFCRTCSYKEYVPLHYPTMVDFSLTSECLANRTSEFDVNFPLDAPSCVSTCTAGGLCGGSLLSGICLANQSCQCDGNADFRTNCSTCVHSYEYGPDCRFRCPGKVSPLGCSPCIPCAFTSAEPHFSIQAPTLAPARSAAPKALVRPVFRDWVPATAPARTRASTALILSSSPSSLLWSLYRVSS